MKRYCFFLSCAVITLSLNAQLKINNIGNVGIGGSPATTSKMYVMGERMMAINAVLNNSTSTNKFAVRGTVYATTGRNFGAVGESSTTTSMSTPSGDTYYPATSAGMLGVGYGSSHHGVVGNVLHNNLWASAAIYGMVGGIQTSLTANIAGAFTGNVKSTGNISAVTVTTTSDATLKQNIAPIEEDVLAKFNKLQPVQYYWNKEAYIKATYEDSEKFTEEQMEYVTNLIGDDVHYGLLAQDLQEIFPELVNDKEKTLSINYIELIPMLIQAVQNLNNELQELKHNTSIKKQPAYNPQSAVEDMAAVLYQNTPNPFSEQTHIKYQLPASVADARIYVYDMSGNQLGEYALSERGENTLTISANEYNAGMYLYALIADGQVVDTKRMILTK